LCTQAALLDLNQAALLDLPLEVLTAVCLQFNLRDLARVAEVCKRFRHGDGGLETEELPTKSSVVTALLEHASPGGRLIPSKRPIGCSESWVAYLARCARQRRCQENPPMAAGLKHSMFADAAGRLLTCGQGAAVGHGDAEGRYLVPTPVAAMARVWVRSVAAGFKHSLALSWDGRVYSWGSNELGQLGHGDKLDRPLPTLVEGLDSVCGIATNAVHSLAVTHSGDVFCWGRDLLAEQDTLRPIIVEGFGGVRMRQVSGGAFAIGEAGELFSWGPSHYGSLGHGNEEDQPSPKRVEALRGVRVSSISVGQYHALALAEDGLVYAWGQDEARALLGNPYVEAEPLPKPVEALRGVWVGSIAAAGWHTHAVADTGEVWAWGHAAFNDPLGHGDEQRVFPQPKPIESLRGVKVDAVVTGEVHKLALADDGSVYAWGSKNAVESGSLGPGPFESDAQGRVATPQLIPALRVACGL
jgi:alpha-tubulin suppressor-like RCC1 family protein